MTTFKYTLCMSARAATATLLVFAAQAQAQAPFAKPELAADALIAAVAASDPLAIQRVLGPNWKKAISMDEVTASDRYAFLEKAHQSRSVKVADKRGELWVGTDPWPLPIPLLQGKDGQWRFDTPSMSESLLEREIGANERSAILASLAYVDAQREYAERDRSGDGLLEYAQRLISSPGKRNGLIWSASLGDESPLGEDFVPAKSAQGYHGYHFKILKSQGSKAKGGERSYLIGNRMVAGYALLAWPVRYGSTGVMSFMVNQEGQVFERDLGPQTAKQAAAIGSFNPDEGWKPAQP